MENGKLNIDALAASMFTDLILRDALRDPQMGDLMTRWERVKDAIFWAFYFAVVVGEPITLIVLTMHFGVLRVGLCFLAGAIITGVWVWRAFRRNAELRRRRGEIAAIVGPNATTMIFASAMLFWPLVAIVVTFVGEPKPKQDDDKTDDPPHESS